LVVTVTPGSITLSTFTSLGASPRLSMAWASAVSFALDTFPLRSKKSPLRKIGLLRVILYQATSSLKDLNSFGAILVVLKPSDASVLREEYLLQCGLVVFREHIHVEEIARGRSASMAA
jgi:hypothetical protein